MLRFVVWNCVEREDQLVFSRGWDQLRHCASEKRFLEPPQLNWKDCNENWELLLQPHWSIAFRHLFFLCISQMMSGRLRDLDGVGGVLSLLSSTFCWNQVKLRLNILELMESPFFLWKSYFHPWDGQEDQEETQLVAVPKVTDLRLARQAQHE